MIMLKTATNPTIIGDDYDDKGDISDDNVENSNQSNNYRRRLQQR